MNFIINYTIYPCSVLFSFADKDKEVAKILRENGVWKVGADHKYEQGQFAITVHYSNGFTLIRMPVMPKTPEEYGALQHEIFHAVVYLMEHVGASLSKESNENFAYVIEYLTTEAYKILM